MSEKYLGSSLRKMPRRFMKWLRMLLDCVQWLCVHSTKTENKMGVYSHFATVSWCQLGMSWSASRLGFDDVKKTDGHHAQRGLQTLYA